MSPGTPLLLCSSMQNTTLRRCEKDPQLCTVPQNLKHRAIPKIGVKNDMRLQLKLGCIATKSKDGAHLLRADVCQAATSTPAQARFTIERWGKSGFSGTPGPCPSAAASGRLEGSRLRSPRRCLPTTEAARRGRPNAGRAAATWSEARLASPGPRLSRRAQRAPQQGPAAGCPLTNLEHLS